MKQLQQKIRRMGMALMTQFEKMAKANGLFKEGIGKSLTEVLTPMIGKYFISGAGWAIRHQWNITSPDCKPAKDEDILMSVSGKLEVGKGRDLMSKGAEYWMAIPKIEINQMTEDMKKCFFEESTGRYTETLAAAKGHALQKRMSPKVYRIWKNGDKVIGKALIYAYGESVATIKKADACIAKPIEEDRK